MIKGMDERKNEQANSRASGYWNGSMSFWTDGFMGGWVDRQLDG